MQDLAGKSVVDGAEFAAIQCNRCGVCCEALYLDYSPARKLWQINQSDRHFEGMTHMESVRDAQMVADMLEPTGEVSHEGRHIYRCTYFKRDDAGLGVCTVYDKRPRMCSRFPYGKPATFKGCTWNVHLVHRHLPVLAQR